MDNLIVCVLLVSVYLVINLLLPRVPMDPLVKSYLVQPALWGLVILALRRLPGYRTLVRQSLRRTFLQLALAIGCGQVFLYIIGGFFSGFGKSPSSFTPLGITGNLFFVGLMLVALEIGRARLITRMGKRHTFLAMAVTTLVFTFLSIPLGQITGFQLQIQSANLVISNWVPLLAENLLASYLALLGGARVSLAYRGLLAAFWWFCPILPDLNWSLKGLIGVGAPILGMIAVSSFYMAQINRGKSRSRARKAAFPTGWIITALLCLVMVWFAVGVFPFQPSVIPTGSMIPEINPGDVVIVAKTPASTVKLGDIIEFRNVTDQINIVHRVIEIRGEEPQRFFVTKGDNNNSPDTELVPAQNVIGKVVLNIPKLGWISLFLKSLFSGAG